MSNSVNIDDSSSFFTDLWTDKSVFTFIIFFSWVTFLWDIFLQWRQYCVYKRTLSIPTEFSGVLESETFNKARLYNIDKSKFGFYSGTWSQLFSTIVLVYNGIPYVWKLSRSTLDSVGYNNNGEIIQTIVFIQICSIISTILDIPWSLYYTFVLEEKHGFNKETLGFYVKDKIKKFIVTQAIISPIFAGAIYIIKRGGNYFFVYLWLFTSFLVLVFMTVYADYIAPFFDKYTALPEGELRTKIETLAKSIDFPLTKLYVVEGSKRSAHSNAYFYGFYKNKRIVLFDTLIEDYEEQKEDEKEKNEDKNNKNNEKKKTGCSTREILAILAHELGHWKLNHVFKNIIIAEVNMFFCFMVFGLLFQNDAIYSSIGFVNEKPVFIGLLVIFQYIFSPYTEIVSFLMTCLSRRFEFAADAFARGMNKAADLRSALIKLNKDNLSFPIYDWLYSSWYHSHPPLLERIQALGKFD